MPSCWCVKAVRVRLGGCRLFSFRASRITSARQTWCHVLKMASFLFAFSFIEKTLVADFHNFNLTLLENIERSPVIWDLHSTAAILAEALHFTLECKINARSQPTRLGWHHCCKKIIRYPEPWTCCNSLLTQSKACIELPLHLPAGACRHNRRKRQCVLLTLGACRHNRRKASMCAPYTGLLAIAGLRFKAVGDELSLTSLSTQFPNYKWFIWWHSIKFLCWDSGQFCLHTT